MSMTALNVSILVRAYWSAETCEEFMDSIGCGASAKLAVENLMKIGMLKQFANASDGELTQHYALTERGNVYVKFLLDVPLPEEVRRWVVPPFTPPN